MANLNAPFGLRLVGRVGGSTHTARINRYAVASGDNVALFIGDAVSTPGTNAFVTINTTGEILPVVTQATVGAGSSDGTAIRGVVVGIDPIDGVAVGSENLNRLYRPASTQMVVMVCDDPMALFEIMYAGTFAGTLEGNAMNISATPVGSTATGISGMTADTAFTASSTKAQLKLAGTQVKNTPNNSIGLYSVLQVMINYHELASGTGGF